jgi:serine/threonine protein phosphatase PrpC
MRIDAVGATDIGRVRDHNEDGFLVEAPLFAVADGVGGHLGGEVASRLALETLHVQFAHRKGTLVEQVHEANRAVYERSSSDPSVAGMGTTLTVVVVEGDRIRLAHVGDSRAYLLRGGELRPLTDDHTLVQLMVDRGEISSEEARVHPQRNVVTRVIGTEPEVVVDEGIIDLQAGDRVLLCSDGLTAMLDDEEIATILIESADPRIVADRLVRAANDAGGVDNVTVVLLDATDDVRQARPDAETEVAAADTRTIVAPPEVREPRPAEPPRARRQVRLGRVAAWVLGVALVATISLVGARTYLDAQWYVGATDGRVAIFRGVPSTVLGFRLSHVVVETSLPSAPVARLPSFTEVAKGIPVESRDGADEVVAQMRTDLTNAEQQAEPKPNGGSGNGGSAANGGGGGGGAAQETAA